ncbi:sensor histidine kinase [Rheinheimera nanhaiensis]|nr:ATP-binding protein [Rheinheimera nanhaiensis]
MSAERATSLVNQPAPAETTPLSYNLAAMRPSLQLLPATAPDPLLQALPAAVILLDQRGLVYQANPAAIALLGEPLLGQAWFNVISRCFRPRSDDGLEVSLKDGRRVKLQISTLPGEAGHRAGQLIMLTDLTETRQLQSRLAHLQRLSSLGKMMASLAHQIRTPLSAALLYAQNLANPRATLQMQQQFQQKLLSRLNDLAQQVEDMLLFARSGSAEQVAPVSLNALLSQLHSSVELLLQQQQATLQVSCADDRVNVLGNQHALCGALQNLIQNSVQAKGCGARIALKLGPDPANSNMLLIQLTDNGPGVAPALQHSLFEPFVTGRANGTGLGLAVVKAVVSSHQGSVCYVPGYSGACFQLRLPVHPLTSEE